MLKVKNKVTDIINTWKDIADRKECIHSFVLKVVLNIITINNWEKCT